jgi:hypothetical protein
VSPRGHPSGPLVRRDREGQRGPAVLAVRVRRRARPGLGHQLVPADPAVRLVQAVPKGQPLPALRLGPEDRRVLAGLARPAGRPDQPDRKGLVSPAGPEGPCGPVQADNASITIAAGMVTNCRITPVRLVPIGNLAARNKCAQSVNLVCPPLEGNSNRSCDRERGCAKQKCIAVVAIGHRCVQSR